jgi:aspartate 1-decarboxylase
MRQLLHSKIHRASVTDSNLDYVGSITICRHLMRAAHLLPYEYVHVNNINNGVRWETYVIPGNTGEIILNGPPARHFMPKDLVVIMKWQWCQEDDLKKFQSFTVFVDSKNKIINTNISDHTKLDF